MAYRKIAHWLKGSDASAKALEVAVDLAKAYGAALQSVAVEPAPHYYGDIGEASEAERVVSGETGKLLEFARQEAARRGVEIETYVVFGQKGDAVAEFARAGRFDLLVVGAQGKSGFIKRLVSASAWQRVARKAPCDVLIVR